MFPGCFNSYFLSVRHSERDILPPNADGTTLLRLHLHSDFLFSPKNSATRDAYGPINNITIVDADTYPPPPTSLTTPASASFEPSPFSVIRGIYRKAL